MRTSTHFKLFRAGAACATTAAILIVGVGVPANATLAVANSGQSHVAQKQTVFRPAGHRSAKQRNQVTRVVAVRCRFSHAGTFDPIVMPGGISHLHHFFGNVTTDENSTGASLLAGGSTCNDSGNRSAYWVPSLSQNGTVITPEAAAVHYYIRGGRAVTPFPVGFKAVSGRSNQTAGWKCVTPGAPMPGRSPVATVPTCGSNQQLVAVIEFGSCWDGSSLDSSNHESHLAFPVKVPRKGKVCPSDHPVSVPRVVLGVRYPRGVTGGPGVTLSSGAPATLHADIFEAWAGNTLRDRINNAPPVRKQAAL